MSVKTPLQVFSAHAMRFARANIHTINSLSLWEFLTGSLRHILLKANTSTIGSIIKCTKLTKQIALMIEMFYVPAF